MKTSLKKDISTGPYTITSVFGSVVVLLIVIVVRGYWLWSLVDIEVNVITTTMLRDVRFVTSTMAICNQKTM